MDTIDKRLYHLRKTTLNLSQTEFANRLGVSRGVIVNLEAGNTELKPQFADLICSIFNVDRVWLTTGEGSMFRESSRRDKIAVFVGKALSDESDTFKADLLELLSDMDAEDWRALKVLAEKFITATKKRGSE